MTGASSKSLTNRTVWLDRGASRRLERGFAHFESWRDEVLAKEEAEQELLAKRIEQEEHWMRYGVTARRKRNMRRVDLLATLRKERKEHVGSLGARAHGGLRAAISPASWWRRPRPCPRASASAPSWRTSTSSSCAATGWASSAPMARARPRSSSSSPARSNPTAGTIRLGTNLQTVTLDQSRQSLDPNATLADVITDGRGSSVTVNGETKHVVSYMKDFLFPPEKARTPVGVLSGGERGRLILARELAKPSNLLVLDEPTNDLDLETLDMLQEMLADYPGTILLVSHDRDFLDRVATSVLMAEGDGKWTEYAGGYSDMVAQRGAGRGSAQGEGGGREVRPPQPSAGSPAGPAQALLQGKARARNACPPP